MKLYEYRVKNDGRKFVVNELEAEEKNKTYRLLERGEGWRSVVKKEEIGCLTDGRWLLMYLVERDDERYIRALIELQEKYVVGVQNKLTAAEITLENYKNLLKQAAALMKEADEADKKWAKLSN